MMCHFYLLLVMVLARLDPGRSFTLWHVVERRIGRAASSTVVSVSTQDTIEQGPTRSTSNNPTPRLLHQNWWPASILYALDTGRPNALQVLGKKLVAMNDGDSWKVLDDRCSHRFAPLSEGRIQPRTDGTNCLQCAYHGWEFDSSGTCTRVPQQQNKLDKARRVQSYPTQVDAGILWVWMDPASATLATTVHPPVNPLLREYVNKMGAITGFMRDLPYGYEILGENLLDLSHLPFSHHSVGSLRRDNGGSLPTRMVPESERIENAAWEKLRDPGRAQILPTFQAEITNASRHDPIYVSSKLPVPENATTTVAFYESSHVRYRRRRGVDFHVELFLCPVSEGKSRVILYNVLSSSVDEPPQVKSRLLDLVRPKAWKQMATRILIKRLTNPQRPNGHMLAHRIFDGDGIFLHKQGNRMKESGLTFRDYSTPSSCDSLLNAYRRFMEDSARQTRLAGFPDIAQAVVGDSNYDDNVPRATLLDRYHTHTKFCPVCRTALSKARRNRTRWNIVSTALLGSAGALMAQPRVFWLAACLVGWCTTLRVCRSLDHRIESFLFQDYVHAEKQ